MLSVRGARGRSSGWAMPDGSAGRHRGDEGVYLVIWAVAIVCILHFAALAIDLGNIAQTKQHAQNSADWAALAAVGDLAPVATGVSAATAEANAVLDVEQYVQQNEPSVAKPDWTNSLMCPSGALPAKVSASSATNCIGFFIPPSSNLTNPTGLAVVVPSRNVGYTLG
jgi:uncharacterized membrane protein